VKYLAVARLRLMGALMYDRDVLVRSAFMVVAMVVFIQLWTTTYAATGQATVQGFSVRELIWYLVITEIIALSTPRVAQTIDSDVRSGDVAYALARPYNYPLYQLAAFWGETLPRLPLNALLGGAVAFVAVGAPRVTPQGVVVCLILGVGAITLKAMFEILIGLTAFWVEDTQPAEWIYNKLLFTIGGLFLPLELFPAWLAAVARALPFASIMYAPARAFVGGDDPGVLVSLGTTQLVWLFAMGVIVLGVFAQATRRVVAHGG
jgi:viologen exporter family transport system permease protein